MIKRCDHPGCTKAGICRAPKARGSNEHWMFCRAHAAEYNKNWNYYQGMSPDEIQADWAASVFGTTPDDAPGATYNADYIKNLNDFLSGRSAGKPAQSTLPQNVVSALAVLGLPITASWKEISAKYRTLAKANHPDTARDKDAATKRFTQISSAYDTLRKHFGKK